jgi:hypothetical protein
MAPRPSGPRSRCERLGEEKILRLFQESYNDMPMMSPVVRSLYRLRHRWFQKRFETSSRACTFLEIRVDIYAVRYKLVDVSRLDSPPFLKTFNLRGNCMYCMLYPESLHLSRTVSVRVTYDFHVCDYLPNMTLAYLTYFVLRGKTYNH